MSTIKGQAHTRPGSRWGHLLDRCTARRGQTPRTRRPQPDVNPADGATLTNSVTADLRRRGTVTLVPELLFSYGTLRQRDVQLTTFGRELDGSDDAIVGYQLDWVTITDARVIETSGSDRHPILQPGTQDDAVAGSVFEITDAELAAADEYEVDDYQRVQVPLRSGRQAWVYVFAG